MVYDNHAEDIYRRPVELLQKLITFDTTNPPGNEAPCIKYIDQLLNRAGIKTTLLSKDPRRLNLLARLKGRGSAPPLLLYGHVDVVTTVRQEWRYPPFSGEIADGFVWGRGALDMKGGITMMLSAFLRARAREVNLPGDVVLCLVSDEENFGGYGSRFLVENHGELFSGIRYALGEFGGFSLYVSGKKFYPIEIAQKQKCGIRAVIRGAGGPGHTTVSGGAMAKLAKMLTRLDENYLPVHITPAARIMFEAMAEALPFPTGLIIRQLLKPKLTDFILNRLGQRGKLFAPLFHNTVNATILRASEKINVVPGEIEVEMDGRLLPGLSSEDFVKELHALIGGDIQLEVLFYEPGPGEPDMGLFPILAEILEEADPEGIPVPLLISGATDGRLFSKLGIQTYGFIPMQLPEDMNFVHSIHAADERIPVDSLRFGAEAIFQVLQRFHQ